MKSAAVLDLFDTPDVSAMDRGIPQSIPQSKPEPIALHTHCKRCSKRLAQLEGVYSTHYSGWLCDECAPVIRQERG